MAAFALAAVVSLGLTARAGDLWNIPAASPEPADEYLRLMAEGDRQAITSGQLRVQGRRDVDIGSIALKAVAAYESASRLRPKAAEPHYRAAEVIHRHFLQEAKELVFRDRTLAERALDHWRAFETLAPLDPRVTDTLFNRAIVATKLATEKDFEYAIACYEALLTRTDITMARSDLVATWLSNLAETYMMVGRLDQAIEMYEQSLTYNAQPLYGYGLAVALDRNGQTDAAREVMYTYGVGDRLGALTDSGIFFVPEGELDYYLALGNEALGNHAAAADHYRRFIKSGAHPRYQPRAGENLQYIEKQQSKAKPARTPGDKPLELGPGDFWSF